MHGKYQRKCTKLKTIKRELVEVSNTTSLFFKSTIKSDLLFLNYSHKRVIL